MMTAPTLLMLALVAVPARAGGDPCEETARLQLEAEHLELREDLLVELATCGNLLDPLQRDACLSAARSDFLAGLQLAQDRFDARIDLCQKLGGGVYDPVIDPADFSTSIDNPWLPFPVGAEWVYESDTEDGLETITVTVLPQTRTILGVECVSVRDVVELDGECIEDTIDWYAQDAAGNVWYFGEISFNFEDGFVADIDGSWLAGVEGAKPGIVMLGQPTVGTTYRQEWWLGEAEDAGTVLDVDATVAIPFGTFAGCIQTEDFLPPEPDALEHKFYAPGIGFVYEVKPDDGEFVELVSFTP